MAERGLEHGLTPGLGWIDGEVRAIAPSDATLKIPHMGWNTLDIARKHALFEGIPTGESGLNAYFVHSYHLVPCRRGDAGRHHRLWRPDHRLHRQGQYGGQPVPPREEPEARPGADRQFPQMEAMILFPAIDLKDGQCVRLRQGEMAEATVFNTDPAAQARDFEEARLRLAACGRSERRVRREAGERAGGRGDLRRGAYLDPARRRHPRSRHHHRPGSTRASTG